MRVRSTDIADLYGKVASYQAEVYGHYPEGQAAAAIMAAVTHRMMQVRATPYFWVQIQFWISWFFNVPLLAISWVLQGFSMLLNSPLSEIPLSWDFEPTYMVSARWDSVLPGLAGPLCDSKAVPFFFLPPRPTRAARFANFSARFHVWCAGKLAAYFIALLFRRLLPHVPSAVNWTTYLLEMNWTDTPLGALAVAFAAWYGVRPPEVPLPAVLDSVRLIARQAYASVFFIPSARLRYKSGLSLWYQLALISGSMSYIWPRLNPLYWVVSRLLSSESVLVGSSFAPAEHPAARGIVVSFVILHYVLALGFSLYSARPRSDLPFHADCQHFEPSIEPNDEERCCPSEAGLPPPASDASSMSSFHISPPTPVLSPVPSDVLTQSAPPQLPPPGAEVPLQPLPPRTPPPMPVGTDPYARFHLPPAWFGDLVLWRDTLRTRGGPPMTMDPDNSCVWHCLSATFNVPSDVLLAVWLAGLQPADRAFWFDGMVPEARLPEVFSYFQLGVTLRLATMQQPDCPRAPGVVRPDVFYDNHAQPHSTTQAQPGWPTVTYFLASTGTGRFHLAANATVRRGVGTITPAFGAMIGYVSRQVSRLELGQIVNMPHKVFMRSWSRLAVGYKASAAMAGLPSQALDAYHPLIPRPVQRESRVYTLTLADLDAACHLAQDLKNNPQAMDIRGYNMEQIARANYELAKRARDDARRGLPTRSIQLHMFHGIAGCGKTRAALQYVQQVHSTAPYDCSNIRFHTWLNGLRGPLERAASQLIPGLRSFNFQTGAMPLAQPLGGTLVFDDATQLWPGFIPLCVLLTPGLTDLVLTFDVAQGSAAVPVSDSVARDDPTTAEWLTPLSSYYATLSWRFARGISDLFGLPVPTDEHYRPLAGVVATVSNVINDLPLLVVSPRFATSQNAGGQRCLTFQECQGLTIDGDMTIDLGGLSATATEAAWWTALTRARGNILLFLGPLSQGPVLDESFYGRSNIINAMLAVAVQGSPILDAGADPGQLVARAVQAHLSRKLSAACLAHIGLVAPQPVVGSYGVSARYRADWLESPRDSLLGDWWTARAHRAQHVGMSNPGPAFSRHTNKPLDPETAQAPYMLRHYASIPNDAQLHADPGEAEEFPAPLLTVQPDPIYSHMRPVDADRRERVVRANANTTRQHVHDGPTPLLHHTRHDKLTVSWSEKHRVRVGKDTLKLNAVERGQLKQLKKGFAKFFDVPAWNKQGFDGRLFSKCARKAYSPWVSKRSKKDIARAVAKNNPDSPYTFAQLFLKGQYIKKEEKRFAKARPGQIISEFNMGRNFRDAPFALYVEEMALRYAFKSTYLHTHRGPTAMNRWYQRHWTPGETMSACDGEAWDTGCNRVTVHFAAWLMALSGVPEEYICKYKWEKSNIFSYLGPHEIKVESGDRWTWLINSMINAGLTGASLNCPPRTPAGFSGDDGILCGLWGPARDFRPHQWAFKPKREYGDRLLFCGYAFGGHSISLAADVVLHRAQNGMALGRSDPDYWRSVKQGLSEASRSAPDWSAPLAVTNHFVIAAATRYGFEL